MHRTLSTGPSTIAALMAASRPEPARDTALPPEPARPWAPGAALGLGVHMLGEVLAWGGVEA